MCLTLSLEPQESGNLSKCPLDSDPGLSHLYSLVCPLSILHGSPMWWVLLPLTFR